MRPQHAALSAVLAAASAPFGTVEGYVSPTSGYLKRMEISPLEMHQVNKPQRIAPAWVNENVDDRIRIMENQFEAIVLPEQQLTEGRGRHLSRVPGMTKAAGGGNHAVTGPPAVFDSVGIVCPCCNTFFETSRDALHHDASSPTPALPETFDPLPTGQHLSQMSEVERIRRVPHPPRPPPPPLEQPATRASSVTFDTRHVKEEQWHQEGEMERGRETEVGFPSEPTATNVRVPIEPPPRTKTPVPPPTPRSPEGKIEMTMMKRAGHSPPPLPLTNDPFILLGAKYHPKLVFDDVRSAYKRRVKMYHPDRVSAPGSAPAEREAANQDFARINAAYHLVEGAWEKILRKRRKNAAAPKYRDGFWGHGRGVVVPGAEADDGRMEYEDDRDYRGSRYHSGGNNGGGDDFFATVQGGSQYSPMDDRGSLQNQERANTFFQSHVYSPTGTNRVTVESNCHVTGKEYPNFSPF